MADVRATLPGTWFLTVTRGDGSITHTVITFTSDGGLVERAEPRVEAGVGVWEAGDEDNEFRFMFLRFVEKLTVTPTPGNPGRVTQDFAIIFRVRSTNRLIDDDMFTGTGRRTRRCRQPARNATGVPYHGGRCPGEAGPGARMKLVPG